MLAKKVKGVIQSKRFPTQWCLAICLARWEYPVSPSLPLLLLSLPSLSSAHFPDRYLSFSLSLKDRCASRALCFCFCLFSLIMSCFRSLPFSFLATFLFLYSDTFFFFSFSHGDSHSSPLQTLPATGTTLPFFSCLAAEKM